MVVLSDDDEKYNFESRHDDLSLLMADISIIDRSHSEIPGVLSSISQAAFIDFDV